MTIGFVSYLTADNPVLDKIRIAGANFRNRHGRECQTVLVCPEVYKTIDLDKIDFPFQVKAYDAIVSPGFFWAIEDYQNFMEIQGEKHE
jgi:hypothetical protein